MLSLHYILLIDALKGREVEIMRSAQFMDIRNTPMWPMH